MILAIIVAYNPNEKDLLHLIESVEHQVDKVIVVDNSSISNEFLIAGISMNIHYMPLYKNLGIAKAQNLGIIFAEKHYFNEVLLLDQDSVLPANMVEMLSKEKLKLKHRGLNIAAVGPAFVDNKTGIINGAVKVKFFRVEKILLDKYSEAIRSDHIIASGSLIDTSVFSINGLMREDLFIDWVDIEWCERCNRNNYYSYIIPSIIMEHSIGDETKRLLGRDVNLHSDVRNYYIIRNTVNLIGSDSFSLKYKLLMMLKVPWYTLLYILGSKSKVIAIKNSFKAIKDGLLSKMGQIQ